MEVLVGEATNLALDQMEDASHQDKISNSNQTVQSQATTTIISSSSTTSSGFYDAEKCRAHILNQIKVSKIDRFAAQVNKAIEIEACERSRLVAILNMFIKRSAQVAHNFTFKCKLGLQRHRQDRILNHQRTRPSKSNIKLASATTSTVSKRYSISNDLLYGQGAQLVHSLFQIHSTNKQHIINRANSSLKSKTTDGLSDDDYSMSDSFEPSLFVKQMENYIRHNLRNSKAITVQLNSIRHLFEKLASEHRDKVDLVYAAEEERQAATVIRRSAYNLSLAASKATSTPIHVHLHPA